MVLAEINHHIKRLSWSALRFLCTRITLRICLGLKALTQGIAYKHIRNAQTWLFNNELTCARAPAQTGTIYLYKLTHTHTHTHT